MGELTNDGDGWVEHDRDGLVLSTGVDGWVEQWWRWVSWPIIKMGEFWGMMEMGELSNDGDGWVEQWWRWVSWPMIEMSELPIMEMGEMTNDGDRWADQWWKWVSWLVMDMDELTNAGVDELTSNGDGWVDQPLRWVSWPVMDMVCWPVMDMRELTNDGNGWVDLCEVHDLSLVQQRKNINRSFVLGFVDMTAQQASSQFPLVELVCTNSPPTSLCRPSAMASLTWWQGMEKSALWGEIRVTMDRMMQTQLHAMDWLIWGKVGVCVCECVCVSKWMSEWVRVLQLVILHSGLAQLEDGESLSV